MKKDARANFRSHLGNGMVWAVLGKFDDIRIDVCRCSSSCAPSPSPSPKGAACP